MNDRAFLSLFHDLAATPKYLVRIRSADPLSEAPPEGFVLASSSPIFSLGGKPVLPDHQASFSILFLVVRDAFVTLGRIPTDKRPHVWFSIGITAVIGILTGAVTEKELLAEIPEADVLLIERWEVEKGELRPPVSKIYGERPSVTRTTLPKELPSDPDIRRIIRELYLNFDSLKNHARIVNPHLLPIIEKLLKESDDEIRRLIQQERALASISKEAKSSDTADAVLSLHKKTNLSTDSLVQLNSALAYIISQSFYGGPPLLQNVSLISSHSILGIGTAIKAIQRLTEFVAEGFASHPVAVAIKKFYRLITVETYLSKDGGIAVKSTPDQYLNDVTKAAQIPKLAYFSTRMGFSEHGFCVTAATQCLGCADSARRNLLTVTHELLHSHAKGLFAVLLATDGPEPEGAQLRSLIQNTGVSVTNSTVTQRFCGALLFFSFYVSASFFCGWYKQRGRRVSTLRSCGIDNQKSRYGS